MSNHSLTEKLRSPKPTMVVRVHLIMLQEKERKAMALNITPRDILIRWVGDNKPISEDDETFIELFNDAIEIITDKVSDIEILVSAGKVSLSTVKQVLVAMLTRFYSVAQEYRASYSETVGSFSHSGSYSNGGENAGVMKLTRDELSLLRGIDSDAKVTSVRFKDEFHGGYYYESCDLVKITPVRVIAGVDPID